MLFIEILNVKIIMVRIIAIATINIPTFLFFIEKKEIGGL